jgi:hypothetical protein
MGRHNAKLMLSTLWCRQLTRLSALGAAKSGLPHRPLDRKTCPSHFDALRTVYLKVFGRRPNTVQTNATLSWPAFENLQRRKPRERARRAVPRSAYQPAPRAGFLYNLRVMARRLLDRGK